MPAPEYSVNKWLRFPSWGQVDMTQLAYQLEPVPEF